MSLLLCPAAALMGRLKYRVKFVFIGLLFLLPLVVSLLFFSHEMNTHLATLPANRHSLEILRRSMEAFALCSLLLAVYLFLGFYASLMHSIQTLRQTVQDMTEGDYSRTIPCGTHDELGQLGDDLQIMQATLRAMAEGAQRIAAGDFSLAITPRSSRDARGQAFQKMAVYLQAKMEEANSYAERLEAKNAELQTMHRELLASNQDLIAANVQLETLATIDGMTGLENHRTFQERLKEEMERANRSGRTISLILLDVDRFKLYNDTYGHPAGDQVLKQVAEILRQTVRMGDFVARYGGEEFVVLMPETAQDDAKACAERLRAAMENAVWKERSVTASLGVATQNLTLSTGAALIAATDAALYRSKQRGRNCVTHANDPVEAQQLSPDSSAFCEEILQQLLTFQNDQLLSTSHKVQETLAQAYDATIASWSQLLDIKDQSDHAHTERVTELTIQLARWIGLNEEEVLYVRWGSLLHDIGTMGVADDILQKPGFLTDEEREEMRRHTTLAYQILAPIPFLRPALEIPYCHHEKWDGTGYPRGLKGEEIPLVARLFSVVDVYDALRSARPHRAAWTEEETRKYLYNQAGTYFDPRAVDLFIRMLEASVLKQEADVECKAA